MNRFLSLFLIFWCSIAIAERQLNIDPSLVWKPTGSSYTCIDGSPHPKSVVKKNRYYILSKQKIQSLKRALSLRNKKTTLAKIKKLKKGISVCKHAKHIHSFEITITPTETPTPTADPLYLLRGIITYQDQLAPSLNGTPVKNVIVKAFRQPEQPSDTPVASTLSANDGSYMIDLKNVGAGTYRLSFTSNYQLFSLIDGSDFISDNFTVPAANGIASVIAIKYSLGSYGLPAMIELFQAGSRANSKIPFLRFSIPAVTVPNTINGPCDVNNVNAFCFDPNRSNSLMKSMFNAMGDPQTDYDQKLIIRAGFWRNFQISREDPACAQPEPTPNISQKTAHMIPPSSESEHWSYSIPECSTPIPAQDIRNDLGGVVDFFSNAPVSAITFDEENRYGDENYGTKNKSAYLKYLYLNLKQRFPQTSFFQWYSPNKLSNAINKPAPGNSNLIIPDISPDGWIVDQYPMLTKDEPGNNEGDNIFPLYIQRMFERSHALTSILWASPNWDPSVKGTTGSLTPDCNFWNTTGWKRFYVMLATNRNNFLATGFDFHAIMKDTLGKFAAVPIWKAQSVSDDQLFYNPALEYWFLQFKNKTIPYFLSHVKISETIPSTRPDWIPQYEYWRNYTPKHPAPECR